MVRPNSLCLIIQRHLEDEIFLTTAIANSTKLTMSKRQFKSQASSSRVIPGAFGPSSSGGFGSSAPGFGATSPLSWITETPDLSQIQDPNVVVSFKGLSKKSDETRAKSLEDLQGFVRNAGEVEEAVLEAWVGFLPHNIHVLR